MNSPTSNDDLNEQKEPIPSTESATTQGTQNTDTAPIDTQTLIEKLQAEKNELQDKYLRLVAEFDNYKKRSFREKMDTIQTAGKDIMISLLDVLDDTERAAAQFDNQADMQTLTQGVQLVFTKLRNNLQNKGLKKLESKGETFDVEKHEAITELSVADEQKGKGIDVVQEGYMLNDKLIRFAKVVVGK